MHCKLIQHAREIVKMHRSHRGLRFTHVRSHTNNTSNELTDRVADLARRGVTINGSPEIIPFEIPLGDRSALPSPLSLSMPTLSGTPLSLSPLIPSPGSVLSSQCPMLRGLLVSPIMFSRCRLLASVVATFLDAEPAHRSSSRWLVLGRKRRLLAEVMVSSWWRRLPRRLVLIGVSFGWPRY